MISFKTGGTFYNIIIKKKPFHRFGIQHRIIKWMKSIFLYPYVSVKRFVAVELWFLRINTDDGFAKLEDGSKAWVIKNIITYHYIFYCSRFKPAIGIAGN
jgi:hypothetical protein